MAFTTTGVVAKKRLFANNNNDPSIIPFVTNTEIITTTNNKSLLWPLSSLNDNNEDDDYDDEEIMEMPPEIDSYLIEETDLEYTKEELQSMTVTQLKQQLRLRGKKVGGNKSQLIDRLLETTTKSDKGLNVGEVGGLQPGYSRYEKPYTSKKEKKTDTQSSGDTEIADSEKPPTINTSKNKANESNNSKVVDSKRVAEAKARGGDIVDVSEYIDNNDEGRAFRSSDRIVVDAEIVDIPNKGDDESTDEESSNEVEDNTASSSSSSPEVWGEDARIVDDYEGRSVVVDGLSRTVIEYTGCNNTIVHAYVVGSRDSLKNFMRGGGVQQKDAEGESSEDANTKKNNKKRTYSSMEEEVYALQKARELSSSRGLIRPDEVEGADADVDDTTSSKYDTIERDYGDWGIYTPTGAQLSSSEVQGVLLLSDVYGAFTTQTQTLADKIAFECQPVVVIVPDLFRGKPWTSTPTTMDETNGNNDGVERNEDGKTYEEWRATHSDYRVDIDIRAAGAVLRERYGVSSIAVWGTCYGGGRALEVAAGWTPGGSDSYYEDVYNSNDEDDRKLPPHVDPIAAIAWYPTRYNAQTLFGKNHEGFRTFDNGKERSVAVMAVFAENDSLEGAKPQDAMLLQQCLEEDSRIKDYMVKIFPGQEHGFAHSHLGFSEGGTEAGSDAGEQGGEMDRFLGDDYGSIEETLGTGGDAEVACLLSTAWMETYTRVFLPTVGTPVKYDTNNEQWSALDMMGGNNSQNDKKRRDIRNELNEAITNFEDVDIDLQRMSQSSSPLLDGPGSEAYDKIEEERERMRQQILEKYNISEDDDEETFDRKFEQARKDGALDNLLLDAYMDESNDAYW